MIRSPASRIFSTSRQALQLGQVSAKNFTVNSHSSHQSVASMACWMDSYPLSLRSSLGDDDRSATNRRHRSSLGVLPRISLDPQDSVVRMSQRCFSSSSASPSSPNNDPSSTFRERMEARRDQGRQAAADGAHSLRGMVQKYGKVFIGTYLAVYFSTLGILFTGIESGVLDPAYVLSWVSDDSMEDGVKKSTVAVVAEFMDHYSWTRPYKSFVENNPELANLGVAWIAVKFTEPIRFGTTVAIVPRLSRYLGYAPAAVEEEVAKETHSEIKEGETWTAKNDSPPTKL